VARPQDDKAAAANDIAAPTDTPEPPASAPENTTPAPLIASMAPFPATASTASQKQDAPAVNSGGHTLRLHLAEASWVEITAADGEKIEYGLLPAGSTRNYDSAKPLDVRIGNSNGATFEIDGKAKDIAPFRHSNVAHFKLADGETTAPHSGG
jgi:cytoskeleton protein RodZ